VRFANDATAQFAITPDAGTREEIYELLGPGYSIHIDALAGRLRIHDGSERVVSWAVDDEMPRYVRNGTMAETAAFLDAVERGDGFAPTLSEGVVSLTVAEALDAGGERTLEEDIRTNNGSERDYSCRNSGIAPTTALQRTASIHDSDRPSTLQHS
jgi:predicted dehydrogenase